MHWRSPSSLRFEEELCPPATVPGRRLQPCQPAADRRRSVSNLNLSLAECGWPAAVGQEPS